jgi:hypothetical protein
MNKRDVGRPYNFVESLEEFGKRGLKGGVVVGDVKVIVII